MRSVIALLLILLVSMLNAQQWSIVYDSDECGEYIFTAGDNSDEYDYFVGFRNDDLTGECTGSAICADESGVYKDKVFWQNGSKSKFTHVLGLGNGNVFVSALYSDNVSSELYDKLWVSVLNPDLDIVYESYIDIEEPYITFVGKTYTLRNDNGEIVLLTRVADYESYHVNNMFDYVFYVFNDSCDLLRQSRLENDTHRSDIADFTQIPDLRCYAVYGNGMHVSGMSNVIFVDEDFDYLSMEFFDDMNDYPDLMLPARMCVGHWYDESRFLMSAQTTMTSGVNSWCPLVVKMDTEMNVVKSLDLERVDTTDYVFEFNSMSYVNPNKIYIATFWERRFLPNELNVYMINDNLELLGKKKIVTEDCFYGLHIHSTKDGGCVIAGKNTIPDSEPAVIYKIGVEDFGIDLYKKEYEYDSEMCCYPNPVSSVLKINVENLMRERVQMTIVDEYGRRYMDGEFETEGNVLCIDVSSLMTGIYFYEISSSENSISKNKFVKQ